MTSPNRPPLSKRLVLVAATAGTFVLGSAGVAFANTHDSTGVGVQPSVESSTSVGETTSVENPTAPALETKTFATRGGTVVVQIDHANHRVTLVSATPADGWTVKSHNTNPHGHGFVDVRFRMVTATDPSATSTTDDSGHHGNDDKAFTGTEIRVRVGFIAWRQVEFVSTRTFGPVERPVAETSTTVEGSLEATSTTVDDDQNEDQADDNGKDDKNEDKAEHQKAKDDKNKTDSTHGRGNGNDDPAIHDQADDHGGRGQGGNNGGGGGNRGSGDNGGGDRGGNGGGGGDQGGRHG